MITLEQLTTFLGWCSVINIALLLFYFLFIVSFREFTLSLHSKLFNLDRTTLNKAYFDYLALYKILIIVLNVVPYIALKIIA
ncbi:MAG TPA: hypothetical protein ENL00_01860 [Nitratifractor sp.]|nr:hypothetical protein [Nitratifractor sp.]HHD74558.1 hypothetical protein [Nitratifractor sp.]